MKTKKFSILSLIFIGLAGVGLFLIVCSNDKKVKYKNVILPLIFYLLIKYSYGLIMRIVPEGTSSVMVLYFSLILLSVISFSTINLKTLWANNKKGCTVTALTKLPNAIGLVAENAVISISLTSYSMIQPIILVSLFFIGVFKKEKCSILNIVGGLLTIISIFAFQLVK